MRSNGLYYKRKGQWIPLPQWGQFFLELGYVFGTQEESENRIIAGLALPTRVYAASLTTTGVITGSLSRPDHGNDALKRFRRLFKLASGTSLYYRRENGERVKVIFDGPTSDGSMIEFHSGVHTYKIPPNLALRIEFPSKEMNALPGRSYRQSDTNIPPFLSYLFNETVAKEIILHSRLACIIIGSIGRIEQEIHYAQFAVQDSKGEFLDGSLQDIIRVRKFSENAETYRSDIFYTHSKEHPSWQQEIPEVVIFDGAKSFLKWGASYHYSHCIVLLAQTDPEFDAAVQAFNEGFIKNHLDDVVFKRPLKIPKGVPISVYQETRKCSTSL